MIINNVVRLSPLTENNLSDFESLLGGPEFGGCFCAVWTSHNETWESRCKDPLKPNFKVSEKNVNLGKHVGYLVYEGENLVGWTGSGPKTAFPLLSTKLESRLSQETENVWSIGCISVAKEFRGQGLSRKIVKAVCEEAIMNGAKSIEAYPVKPFDEARSYRGTCSLYERLGFSAVAFDRDEDHQIVLMQYRFKPGMFT